MKKIICLLYFCFLFCITLPQCDTILFDWKVLDTLSNDAQIDDNWITSPWTFKDLTKFCGNNLVQFEQVRFNSYLAQYREMLIICDDPDQYVYRRQKFFK